MAAASELIRNVTVSLRLKRKALPPPLLPEVAAQATVPLPPMGLLRAKFTWLANDRSELAFNVIDPAVAWVARPLTVIVAPDPIEFTAVPDVPVICQFWKETFTLFATVRLVPVVS